MDSFDDADDGAYDPTEFIDEDDEFDDGLDWRYRGRSRDVHRVIGSRSKRLEEVWPWRILVGKKASGSPRGSGITQRVWLPWPLNAAIYSVASRSAGSAGVRCTASRLIPLVPVVGPLGLGDLPKLLFGGAGWVDRPVAHQRSFSFWMMSAASGWDSADGSQFSGSLPVFL